MGTFHFDFNVPDRSRIRIGECVLGSSTIAIDPHMTVPAPGAVLFDTEFGKWIFFVERFVDGKTARTNSLIAVHEDYVGSLTFHPMHAMVGVDSGLVGLFDFNYYVVVNSDVNDPERTDGEFFDQVMINTVKTNDGIGAAIINNSGIVSHTAYGDGVYHVFVARDPVSENIVAIYIDFVDEYANLATFELVNDPYAE